MQNNIIVGFIGKQGTGKTWLMTRYGIKEHIENNRTIFSNYKINKLDYTPITSLKDLSKMKNGIALLDELWLWLWARTSMSRINAEINKIIMLNRKRDMDILFSSQRYLAIDVMLRSVTDYLYLTHLTKKKGFYTVGATVLDETGTPIKRIICNETLQQIGQYYNTREEIGDLKKGKTQLEKGIQLEDQFIQALNKMSFNFIEHIPNSGIGSTWNCDVLAYKNGNCYAFDVKGSTKDRVYLKDYGKKLQKIIGNIKLHGAKPYIAFPDPTKKTLWHPNTWYIHKLTNGSYLLKLSSMPYTDKLIKNSIKLKDLLNY